MPIVIVNDATHANIGALPKGQQAAGYATGSGGVPWTAADKAAHPGWVQIDQSPVNTALNELCDVLDVETGAATIADCAPWAKAALANYRSAARPGQRSPAIYLNLFNVTPVANALIAGGVTSGVGLWVANWNNDLAADAAQVLAGSGPFPVIGVQFRNAGAYDVSAVSGTWLAAVSAKPQPAHFIVTATPGGIWKAGTVLNCDGTGTDSNPWHTETGDGKTWTPLVRQ